MSAFVTAGAGFLLAVLWFDLMFDVQMRGRHEPRAPEPVLASIAGYYARVTTAARTMSWLVAAAMLATLAGIIVEISAGEYAAWVGWCSLALALAPIVLAGAYTVPAAVRLGARSDDADVQTSTARALLRDHVLCFCSIAALLAVQLAGT